MERNLESTYKKTLLLDNHRVKFISTIINNDQVKYLISKSSRARKETRRRINTRFALTAPRNRYVFIGHKFSTIILVYLSAADANCPLTRERWGKRNCGSGRIIEKQRGKLPPARATIHIIARALGGSRGRNRRRFERVARPHRINRDPLNCRRNDGGGSPHATATRTDPRVLL